MPEKTLQEILDFVDSIPEFMCGRNEAKFLYELSKNTKGLGAIVEIGTCAGKSTIALAHAQKEKHGRRINTIDLSEHPEIKSNLRRAGVSKFVNRITARSSAVAKNWHEPIELLWIDGDHRYNGIVHDITCWSRFLVVGGVMAFHDYPSVGGRVVKQTWMALYRKVLSRPDKWRILSDREGGNIFVCERITGRCDEFNSKTVLRQIIRDIKGNFQWYLEEFKGRRLQSKGKIP